MNENCVEVNNVNSPNDGNSPRHDILEVNSYFIDGLGTSSIDKWFTGPVPEFQPVDLGILEHGNGPLADILERARTIANDPSQMTWQMVLCRLLLPRKAIIDAPLQNVPRKDLSHLNRNLDALIEELANRCQRIFYQAAGAPSRCAVVSFDSSLHTERLPEEERPTESSLVFPFRERTIANEVNAADFWFLKKINLTVSAAKRRVSSTPRHEYTFRAQQV